MSTAEGFSLHASIKIAPENVPEFFKWFKIVYDGCVSEPECLFFEVYQSPSDPGEISWVENWSKSEQWFMENQVTKEYYKEYFDVTIPMFLKPRQMTFLSRVGKPFYTVKET